MPTEEQERWGAAVILLSLDVIVPFYAHLGLNIEKPSVFLNLLRETILDNRRTFEADPTRIPDLKGNILNALASHFGSEFADMFKYWVHNVFVFTGQDFAPLGKWYMLLALARTSSQRWNALEFPQGIAEEARLQLEKVFDRSELHALADKIDEQPLSDWDLDMYSLHGFDNDENEPYNWVLEAVKKRRFLAYLRWLVATLSEEQRHRLIDNANALRLQIDTTREFPLLQDPNELV